MLISLIGYLAWVLGGPAWFAPLALLYLGWVFVRSPADVPEEGVDVTVVFPITVVSFVLILLHSHTGWSGAYVPFLVSVGVNSAIAWATFARRNDLPVWLGAAAGAGFPLAILPFLTVPVEVGPLGLALVMVAGVVGYSLYRLLKATSLAARARLIGTASGSFLGLLAVLF